MSSSPEATPHDWITRYRLRFPSAVSARERSFAFFGQDATTMEVKRMFVRPEARGRGIGEGLVAMLLAEAQATGYSRCVLSTHHKLHAAQALYRRAGFREVPCSTVSPSAVPDVEICMELIPFRDAP